MTMIRHEDEFGGMETRESMIYEGAADLSVPAGPGDDEQEYVLKRQQQLAANFLAGSLLHLSGEAGVKLRPQQIPTVMSLRNFFTETANQIGRRVLWPGPPGSGKSMLSAVTAQSAGIGLPMDGDGGPLRGLALVSRRSARDQVIDTCWQISPEARPKAFFPRDDVDIYGRDSNLLVMSYAGLSTLTEEKCAILAAKTDLLILDEVHRGLGAVTISRLAQIMDRGSTTFAISATPDFDEERNSARMLGIETILPALGPREAIETGVTNGVQLIALHSGQSITMESNRDTITDDDIHPLIDSTQRNELIISVMKDMGRFGVQGVVQCLPGGDNRHARLIAELASQEEIPDPVTGEMRKLRVQAVGKHRPTETRESVEQFKAGELDALTFTRALVESFDYAALRYVLSAAPTSSVVDMGQLVGRGARLGDPRITRIFYIMDDITARTKKGLHTPFHVFGQTFCQGEIILPNTQYSSSSGDQSASGGKALGASAPTGLRKEQLPDWSLNDLSFASPVVQKAMERLPVGTILDEILLIKDERKEAPSDYALVASLPVIQQELVTSVAVNYLLGSKVGKDGRPMLVNINHRLYASPEASDYIEWRYRQQHIGITRLEIEAFLADYGWPRLSFDALMTVINEAKVSHKVVKSIVFDKEEARKLLLHLVATPFVDPHEEVHVSDIAQQLDEANSSRVFKIIQKNPMLAKQLRQRRNGKARLTYKIVGALTVPGASDLIEVMVDSNDRIRNLLGDRTVMDVITSIQAEYRQHTWNDKQRPTISREAVETFIEVLSFEKSSSSASSRGSKPHSSEPPAPLDETHRLSGYGAKWSDHANCLNADPKIFDHADLDERADRARLVKHALEKCNGCRVKGDCLLFTLRTTDLTDDYGTRAGLRQSERRKLDREATIAWLEGTAPASPKTFKQDYAGGVKRA